MKVCFVIPYFGKFPNYFKFFLETCSNNQNFDWILLTDIEDCYSYPKNVIVHKITFDQLRKEIQSKFDFQISLNHPYKLCDFKPAYGYIFNDLLKDYDYWGHCDIDLIFGNLNNFINIEKIRHYDKIGHLGHLTLYKNNDEINKLFMKKVNGRYRYKEVFSTPNSCMFDEWDGISINHIFLNFKKNIYLFNDFFDVYPYDENFKSVTKKFSDSKDNYYIEDKISFASLENGKAFKWTNHFFNWNKKEVAYIHFQKRTMEIKTETTNKKILLVPNVFLAFDQDTIPFRYILKSKVYSILNFKKYKLLYNKFLYSLIVKTYKLRHFKTNLTFLRGEK